MRLNKHGKIIMKKINKSLLITNKFNKNVLIYTYINNKLFRTILN